MTDGRIAIIGDVHGHASELEAKLTRLGVDPVTLLLPEDLTVIQVGDLIHKGLESSRVLQMVDTIMSQQPDQWIQLIGNHEAQYIHMKLFEWDGELEDSDAAILERWLKEGKLHAAAATVTPSGNEALVTHAGLTHDVWKTVIGRPRTARDAAARINAGLGHATPWVWAPGEMLGYGPNRMVGPIWASSVSELYPSWLNAEALEVPAPFSQVHGHSSIYQWPNRFNEGGFREVGRSLGSLSQSEEIERRVKIVGPARHTYVRLAGATIIGVDPSHGKYPADQWEPLVYRGTAEAPAPVTTEGMAWLVED